VAISCFKTSFCSENNRFWCLIFFLMKAYREESSFHRLVSNCGDSFPLQRGAFSKSASKFLHGFRPIQGRSLAESASIRITGHQTILGTAGRKSETCVPGADIFIAASVSAFQTGSVQANRRLMQGVDTSPKFPVRGSYRQEFRDVV
jgi:hypothetical protein